MTSIGPCCFWSSRKRSHYMPVNSLATDKFACPKALPDIVKFPCEAKLHSIEIPVIKDSWQSSFSLPVTYDQIPATWKERSGYAAVKRNILKTLPPSKVRAKKGQSPSCLVLAAYGLDFIFQMVKPALSAAIGTSQCYWQPPPPDLTAQEELSDLSDYWFIESQVKWKQVIAE